MIQTAIRHQRSRSRYLSCIVTSNASVNSDTPLRGRRIERHQYDSVSQYYPPQQYPHLTLLNSSIVNNSTAQSCRHHHVLTNASSSSIASSIGVVSGSHAYFARSSSTTSTSSTSSSSSIENTPLGGPKGAALLHGLSIHTVPAEEDGHPLSVYTIEDDANTTSTSNNNTTKPPRTPLLLLHGRTWSSVPVYHLMGRQQQDNDHDGKDASLSLMEALYNTHNIQPYALDFRGFGGTPKDGSGFVEPRRCVSDVVSVLNWMDERGRRKTAMDGASAAAGEEVGGEEGSGGDNVDVGCARPALLGWSQGALIAQLVAQRHPDALSKLIL